MVLMQDPSDRVKEVSLMAGCANYCFHVFVKYHYSGNSFFGETI